MSPNYSPQYQTLSLTKINLCHLQSKENIANYSTLSIYKDTTPPTTTSLAP
ncbi:hypothetical protein PAXRUDRAFT_10795 [Paxillus rubicundulus Ve08.2h10]|uniref:Uncharacterized protein n=1 Tax=Paxillus rubicundulus Ve08.2h10 TaxID=930991 RepID=A0A0D0E031_9AGAM|nr:hypothetical protein PAXRUDRAFT_10795 [Paxillus rubicundulus Ve08.2h10]